MSARLMHNISVGMILALAMLSAVPLAAQVASGPPNALQGFSQNRNQPVQIDAASLEVRDKDKMATFLGNVRMVQGDTTLRCRTLMVFYDQDGTPGAMTAAKPGPGGRQQIKRVEAKGEVIVSQKDQIATGDNGTFDMTANTVTLFGGVVVTQGQNILKGERLVVDLTTGVSRVEAGRDRVRAIISQGGGHSGDVTTGTVPGNSTVGTPSTGRDSPKVHPASPSGLY
jgi:lipopolysaccharide export system protein LptA